MGRRVQSRRWPTHAAPVATVVAVALTATGFALHSRGFTPRSTCKAGSTASYPPPIFDRPLGFSPVEPVTVVDTAQGEGVPRQCVVRSGQGLDIPILGKGGIPSADVGAVVLTISTAASRGPVTISAFPTGTKDPGVVAAVAGPGEQGESTVVVPLGTGGSISLKPSGADADIRANVVGFFGLNGQGARFSMNPGQRPGHTLSQDAVAAVTTAPGRPQPSQWWSTVRDGVVGTPGDTGNKDTEVVGVFGKDGDGFVPLAPRRLGSPARQTQRVSAGAPLEIALAGHGGIRATASAALVNLWLTEVSKDAQIWAWPAGEPQPKVAQAKVAANGQVSIPVTVALLEKGALNVAISDGSAKVSVDLLGSFEPARPSAPPQGADDATPPAADQPAPGDQVPPAPAPEPDAPPQPEQPRAGSLDVRIAIGPRKGDVVFGDAVTITAGSAGARTYQCSLDGGAWYTCDAVSVLNNLSTGEHTFSVRGLDTQGHIDEKSASCSWINRQAPSTPPAVGGKPGPANTGVPAGTALTVYDGDMVITQPGTVVDAMDVRGSINVKAPNVVIRRSIIRGQANPRTHVGLVMNYDPQATNLRIEDSELTPRTPTRWDNGIKGGNFIAQRVNIHGTVDGLSVHGNNTGLYDSWIHDLISYPAVPEDNRATHNDGIQVMGGRDHDYQGNNISGGSNAALMVTQDSGATSHLTFKDNWADDGQCTVNMTHRPLGPMVGIIISSNIFGGNATNGGCAVLGTANTNFQADNNVLAGSNKPPRVVRQ